MRAQRRRGDPASTLRGRKAAFLGLAAALLLAACQDGGGERLPPPSDEWTYYGGQNSFNRYSPLTQIDRENVAAVQVLWRRPALEPELTAEYPDLNPASYLRSTPVLVEGMLYAPNAVGLVEAFDPGTGETRWIQRPESEDDASGRSFRGVAYWRGSGPAGGDGSAGGDDGNGESAGRIISVRGPSLHALDAETGEPVPSFGDGGRVDLELPAGGRFGWSSGPIVVGDVIVVAGTVDGAGDGGTEWRGSVREDVRGFNARTGRLVWTFHVIPEAGEFGADTWAEGSLAESGDLGSWCCLSADDDLGYVYVPLSAPTSAYYGGHRPGDNLFSNSLVALDAATGERVWHFQMVHHDIWEYDTVGPPVLGRIHVDGRPIDAVMQASKTAFLYTFDRRTGEPVWPIEEVEVPQSEVPGEATSPTQPIPSRPTGRGSRPKT